MTETPETKPAPKKSDIKFKLKEKFEKGAELSKTNPKMVLTGKLVLTNPVLYIQKYGAGEMFELTKEEIAVVMKMDARAFAKTGKG
jgi:hypothetical protein